jgi:hypothetical protein
MRHDFLDGKYTVIFDETTGRLSALRYGEPWRDLVGDAMVLAMLQRVDALQQEVGALQQRIDGMKATSSASSLTKALMQGGYIDAALAGDCAGLPTPTKPTAQAQPAWQDCDDLNKLGGQISTLLLERTRELWGLAWSEFDRGKAQIGQGGPREREPAAPDDQLAQTPGSSYERPRAA